jgi:hypothetical protein
MARKALTNDEILKILLDGGDDDNNDDLNDLYGDTNNDSTDEDDIENDASEDLGRAREPVSVQRHKKILTPNRLINSLANSLDPTKYDPIQLPEELSTYDCVMIKKTKKVPAKILTWTNQAPVHTGRQGMENIMRTEGGLLENARAANTPTQAWNLFISNAIIDIIVENTNTKIDKKLSELDVNALDAKNLYYTNHTTEGEIRAFIGLLYARGLLGLNHHTYRLLFRDEIIFYYLWCLGTGGP